MAVQINTYGGLKAGVLAWLARSGDARGASTIACCPAATADRTIASSSVLRPDFAGPPTANAGTPVARLR